MDKELTDFIIFFHHLFQGCGNEVKGGEFIVGTGWGCGDEWRWRVFRVYPESTYTLNTYIHTYYILLKILYLLVHVGRFLYGMVPYIDRFSKVLLYISASCLFSKVSKRWC